MIAIRKQKSKRCTYHVTTIVVKLGIEGRGQVYPRLKAKLVLFHLFFGVTWTQLLICIRSIWSAREQPECFSLFTIQIIRVMMFYKIHRISLYLIELVMRNDTRAD